MFECREAIYGRLCLKVVASVLAFIIQIALLVSCDKSFLSQNVSCRSNFFGIDKNVIAFSALLNNLVLAQNLNLLNANHLFEPKIWTSPKYFGTCRRTRHSIHVQVVPIVASRQNSTIILAENFSNFDPLRQDSQFHIDIIMICCRIRSERYILCTLLFR